MSNWKVQRGVNVYFITSTVVEWLPIFVEEECFRILSDSLNYCSQYKGLRVHGYVFMLNHIHLLSSSESNVSDIMRDFKTYTSHELIKLLKIQKCVIPLRIFRQAAKLDRKSQNFKVWQSGFHPIGIETEKFFRQKLDYIHQNPVKKGYVKRPEYWVYSSAGYYAGTGESNVKIDPFC